MVTAILLGLVTLLSCVGLFILAGPRSAPDAMVELKQLPLYPGARSVRYSQVGDQYVTTGSGRLIGSSSTTGSVGTTLTERSNANLWFENGDLLDSIFDFYTVEFQRLGLTCSVSPPRGQSPGAVGSGLDSRLAHCAISDRGFPHLVLTGFQGPNASPPWFKIDTPVSFWWAEMRVNRDQGVTHVGIYYDFASYR